VFTVNCKVGRLIEIRVVTIEHANETKELRAAFLRAVEAASRRPAVIVADYRQLIILDPNAAEGFLENFRTGSSILVERSAIVLSPIRATLALQIERVVRDAHSTYRKVFRVGRRAEAWLGEVLTEPEQKRMCDFLAEVN